MATLTLILLPVMGAVLLAWGAFQVFLDLRTAKQRKVVDRLTESPTGRRQLEVKESLLRKRASDLQASSALDGLMSRLQIVNKLQRVLDQADIDWSASRTLLNLAAITLLAGVGMILLHFSPASTASACAMVFMVPLFWLMRRRKKRIRALVEQLPDVFDLMGQALRAGHALSGAIQMISQQVSDPIGKEFARVFQEQNLGLKVEEALLNMANRVDQMDVRFFVTAVLIQRQTGGDLAEVLDKIGKVIRDRIQLLGTVQALTAEGRLSGWVLLALPVLVFLACLFVNPEYARVLIETPHGRIMLAVAAAMDLMGMAMIKKIINIKV
jgi:tight adherence protein B